MRKERVWLSVLVLPIFAVVYTRINKGDRTNPNIIVFMVDDGGWNDFGFHGSNEIPTPNIDALAYSGVILNNHYAQPMCTPSRAAFMTGRYPYKYGMSAEVIFPSSSYGLPTNLTIMPEYLKKLGYRNHLVGKWHLGSCSKVYTPCYRGFHSHFGPWSTAMDYFNFKAFDPFSGWTGYDLRRNMDVELNREGEYLTRMIGHESSTIIREHNSQEPLFLLVAYTGAHPATPDDPLQAPQETIDKFSYIQDPERRIHAAMVSEIDETVGRIVKDLNEKQMLENSILLFTSDNGGASSREKSCGGYSAGSNWPLRGEKCTLWEGGIRVSSFIWSPKIRNPGRTSNHLIHFTDWLPSFISATGNEIALDGIDGVDIWSGLVNDSPSNLRDEVLIDFHPNTGSGAIRQGKWKLVIDPTMSFFGDWSTDDRQNEKSRKRVSLFMNTMNTEISQIIRETLPDAFKNLDKLRLDSTVTCGSIPFNSTSWKACVKAHCLFNIEEDPCEFFDRSSEEPAVLQSLVQRFAEYKEMSVAPCKDYLSDEANPSNWNGVWHNWMD